MRPGQAALVALMLPALWACARRAEEAPATAASEAAPAAVAHAYHVRGIIESLPDVEAGSDQIFLRHEAIPDLVGPGGAVEGMESMTMPFGVAADLDLAGFAAGDRVAFTLEVDWNADRPAVVTALERLPAGTTLGFE